MAITITAAPLPAQPQGLPSSTDGDSGSITSMDFAALLLGQITPGTETSPLLTGDALKTDIPTDASTTALDPATLLASIGLYMPPAIQNPSAKASELPINTGLLNPAGDEAALAITETSGLNSRLSGAQLAAAEVTARNGDSTAQPLLAELSSSETTAKLAGFEQKLADSVAGLAETQLTPQQQASAAQASSNSTASLHQTSEHLRLDTPVKDHAWSAEFGQKIVWLATNEKQNAQITLNPPELGPIEISLNVKSDQATAVFASASPEVREAIESALPRLREMLAGVGVELGQTNVSAESFRQASDNNNRSNSGNGDGGKNGDIGGQSLTTGTAIGTSIKRGNGLVDTFA